MRKKIISCMVASALLLSIMTGCGGVTGGNQPVSTEIKQAENSESDEEMQITYKYEQELNILDDNYRNYYEIFVYSFCDSNGDGVGDLNGITEKLDYIKDMGFNGIWLTPIMPSTTYHKYDVVDYKEIDEEFGTIEDFEKLVEECHKRDIRLIIDFVINHSSSKNDWFLEACKYLGELPEGGEPSEEECPYFGYYNFSKEQRSNTDYDVIGADWYYEGSFWSEMPDLNLENQNLRKEFEEIADFWIEKGVDGFRMDAPLHYVEGNSTVNSEILDWLYTYCKQKNPEFYMVSEVWANEMTIADYYESQTPSMFNFDTSSIEGCLIKTAMGTSNAQKLVEKMVDYQTVYGAVNKDYIDAPFLTNHDQVRVANNLQSNPDNLKMAAGLLMMMNGNPFVYYGEEIGMKSTGQQDENKRLPMRWSDSDSEGMTQGPKGCESDLEMAFSGVKEQLEDPLSLLNYYKRALRLRNENPEIARGTVSIVDSVTDGDIAAITKEYDESKIAVVYNTSQEDVVVALTDSKLQGLEIRGYLTLHGEEITLNEDGIHLPGKSIAILK